jgi:predicted small metal-binding protein
MQMRVRCECGHEIVSEETADLVSGGRRHARQVHGMDVPAQRILALIEPCDPNAELLREASSQDIVEGGDRSTTASS